jgi:hypothetical protein
MNRDAIDRNDALLGINHDQFASIRTRNRQSSRSLGPNYDIQT